MSFLLAACGSFFMERIEVGDDAQNETKASDSKTEPPKDAISNEDWGKTVAGGTEECVALTHEGMQALDVSPISASAKFQSAVTACLETRLFMKDNPAPSALAHVEKDCTSATASASHVARKTIKFLDDDIDASDMVHMPKYLEDSKLEYRSCIDMIDAVVPIL